MRILLGIGLSVVILLNFGSVHAQEMATLYPVVRGTFKMDKIYPKGYKGRGLFNLHRLIDTPKNGQAINYFIFKPSKDLFEKMRDISSDYLFSRLEPCLGGVDSKFARRAQKIGGFIEPLGVAQGLGRYINNYRSLSKSEYIYVAISANLRLYTKGKSDFGYEWVPQAVRNRQICLYIGVGRMGFGSISSRPINVSRLADFAFVD